MKYSDFLKEQKTTSETMLEDINTETIDTGNETSKDSDVVQLLRSKGYKINLVTKTSFGVQIDFAKKYDDNELKKILSDYSIKIKNKSVFIED